MLLGESESAFMKTGLCSLAISILLVTCVSAQSADSPNPVDQPIQQLSDLLHLDARQKPLLVSLEAAAASLDAGNRDAAIKELSAFQHKVRAQLGRRDPALATALIAAAQDIIDGLAIPLRLFDLAADFSPTNSPAGPWSYGYSATLGGSFQIFPLFKYNYDAFGIPIEVWAINEWTVPAIQHNATANTAISDEGQGVFPPGTVWYYPGPSDIDDRLGGEDPNDNYGVIRFTVPPGGAGTYHLKTAVSSAYTGPISGDTDFHVMRYGTIELFGQFLPAEGSASFRNSLDFSDGDTIDFVIGRGADDSFHGSGLIIKVTLTRLQ